MLVSIGFNWLTQQPSALSWYLPSTHTLYPDLSSLLFLSLSVPPCDSLLLPGSPKHTSAALEIVLLLPEVLLNPLPELENRFALPPPQLYIDRGADNL